MIYSDANKSSVFMKKKIALLGSTGSIGTQCLEVCRQHGFEVKALAAGSNVELLERQAREFLPKLVVVADESRYSALKLALADTGIQIAAGQEAVCEAAALSGIDVAVNAVVGVAGLRPTLAALEAGNDLALANKESLVVGGELVTAAVERSGAALFPVDSEHSAIWQCLRAGQREELSKVLLTASGGPFFGRARAEMQSVSVAEAMNHPNWSMGSRITIDCATLMNKGLEFIEAMWLFDLAPEQIEVVVHRQSVIHSAVEFVDGSVIAQMGAPDMKGAIQYAITFPERLPLEGKKLSLFDYGSLTFARPDEEAFPCLAVCRHAAEVGGLAPCVANAADEQAVALFLEGKIGFLQIGDLVAEAVKKVNFAGEVSLESIEEVDRAARQFVLAGANKI